MIKRACEHRSITHSKQTGKKYHKHNKTFTVINLFNKFYGEKDAHGYHFSIPRPTFRPPHLLVAYQNALISQGLCGVNHVSFNEIKFHGINL